MNDVKENEGIRKRGGRKEVHVGAWAGAAQAELCFLGSLWVLPPLVSLPPVSPLF